MKICAISDLHGYLPQLDPCELVLICGDLVSLEDQIKYKKGLNWYMTQFKPWAEALPCNKVLFIFGNHEVCVKEKKWKELFPESDKVTLLHDSLYVYKDKRIYGTPWCHHFGNWAFMTTDDKLKEIYSNIPYNLDILMTHDQPYGYGDILLQDTYWNNHEHIGNIILTEAVMIKQPKYMFVGHLHTTDHSKIMLKDTARYNVSLKDEYYEPIYEPLYLDI